MNTGAAPHLDLVGMREIAARAGVTMNEASTWLGIPDFPVPVADLAMGSVWAWGPIHYWLGQHQFRTTADLAWG